MRQLDVAREWSIIAEALAGPRLEILKSP